MPGVTTWEEAEAFLSQFDSDIYLSGRLPSTSAEIQIPTTEDISPIIGVIDIRLRIQDGIIETIHVYSFDGSPVYRLASFLGFYGQPGEVWLHTFRSDLGASPPITIFLLYPEQGIMAYYYIPREEVALRENAIQGCIQDGPFLYLWSPETSLTIQEVGKMFNLDIILNTDYKLILPLEVATGMSVADFYETFKNPEITPCLETQADLWPDS
jgi:hypothetical protein